MTFLNPLFFLGLAAIAVPILVHLIQNERKRVIDFPSLMFVRKIPYQSVRRRRNPSLVPAAHARGGDRAHRGGVRASLLPQGAVAAAAAGGNREVVILLDQSASMGYGDHWDRARTEARNAIAGLGRRRQGQPGALRPQRGGAGPIHHRSRSAGSGRRGGEGDVRRDAIRLRAAARREHPRSIDAPAPRRGPHLGLPEVGLERRRGREVQENVQVTPVSVDSGDSTTCQSRR